MIGRLISGRYRIEAVLGTGGMAVVYRALDLDQDRIVAIKVLRPEYESDMEFVRRFSREAEAAAKVSHENIVNLLDVGIDGEMRYIVMEYVDGQTLKEMIRDEGRIHPDVALRMTIRILAAVDHAHRNGIVHRDIKPQNILVDRSGRVRVADFGIARLKASQTTKLDPDGSAVGSVHYLSPEQAQGEVADEQSDLYSVGIVMYEMLTGGVPFDGDTAVSVALKHVQEEPESMRARHEDISRALDEVVMRALCKDKQKRYQSAAEMAADLRMTISRPKGGFVRYPKAKRSENKTTKEEIKRPAAEKPRRKVKSVLITIGISLLCVAVLVGALMLRYWHHQAVMPLVIGYSQEEAMLLLEKEGLSATLVNAYSDEIEAGMIMLQSSAEGELLRKDAKITLTVSLGSQWYYLDDLTGWKSEEAISYLAEKGVATVNVDYDQSDLPVGTVISLDAESGTWVSREQPVTVKISGQSVAVPSLWGLTLDGARAVIEAEGLVMGTITEGESADAKSGTVIAQSIAPYTQVLTNTAVDLTICRPRDIKYAPVSPLTLVVPLDRLRVTIDIITPAGHSFEAFTGEMYSGSHQVNLISPEAGMHKVYIYMDDVLFESLQLEFE